jgi:hypothetical protein
MSVEGLRFRWRDEGTIAGVLAQLTAGDPVPAFPLAQTTGLIAVEVDAGDTLTLWLASASPLTAFDYCYVMAGDFPTVDGLADSGTTPALSGQLLLTADVGGAGELVWTEQLRAGFPYRRFSNVAVGSDDVATVVNRLQYVNTTVDTVTVRVYLAAA